MFLSGAHMSVSGPIIMFLSGAFRSISVTHRSLSACPQVTKYIPLEPCSQCIVAHYINRNHTFLFNETVYTADLCSVD